MTDNVCEVCYEANKKQDNAYTCPCGVLICNDCFFDWFKNEIDQSDLSRKVWKCPQSVKAKMQKCSKT